ncbi:MAG TPA: lipopolysaccharide N-acetylglucosaminyl transferase [Burkholderiaceae bacterium]|nr:lipopolysaccharide N-acetylglucosaminyl transferase [Burkholderiaceae bacterium]
MNLLATLAAHLAALVLVLAQSSNTAMLLAYFATQAIASALLALVVLPWLPAAWRRPPWGGAALVFSVDFFVPLAGLCMLIVCAGLARWLPRWRTPPRFRALKPLRYTTFRNAEGTAFRSGQVRGRLTDTSAGSDVRLQALVAVQDAPARTTGELLRDLLADPLEDVRLLAYGLLDNKEKAITQRITRERETLKTLDARQDAAEVLATNKRIAELYWELIYQNLVHGDLLVFAANEAYAHAEAALLIDNQDFGLWFLLGRLGLARNDLASASNAFEIALEHGFPRERLLPYLAELRFRERRFSDVLILVGELKQQRNAPVIEPVLRYWKSV